MAGSKPGNPICVRPSSSLHAGGRVVVSSRAAQPVQNGPYASNGLVDPEGAQKSHNVVAQAAK